MSQESAAARKRRMAAVTQLATAAQTLRNYNQDALARQVDAVADGIATDKHYGKPVQ